jgi:hypothetical protein
MKTQPVHPAVVKFVSVSIAFIDRYNISLDFNG